MKDIQEILNLILNIIDEITKLKTLGMNIDKSFLMQIRISENIAQIKINETIYLERIKIKIENIS